jgi:hypothetical protein
MAFMGISVGVLALLVCALVSAVRCPGRAQDTGLELRLTDILRSRCGRCNLDMVLVSNAHPNSRIIDPRSCLTGYSDENYSPVADRFCVGQHAGPR